jgi:hypothetical protein
MPDINNSDEDVISPKTYTLEKKIKTQDKKGVKVVGHKKEETDEEHHNSTSP